MTSPYRLEAVQLQGVGVFDNTLIRFKPIESAEQDEKLAEIHLFTGPNGCGKSTLLYALAEIFDKFDSDGLIRARFRNAKSHVDFSFLRNGFGSDNVGQYGTRVSCPIVGWNSHESLDFQPSEQDKNGFGVFYWCRVDTSLGQAFGHGMGPYSFLWKYKLIAQQFKPNAPHDQTTFAFAAFAYSGQRVKINEQITGILDISNSPFESALSFDNTVRTKVLLQWIANNRTKSALANMDNNLKDAESYDLALSRITNLVRDVCDMEVEFRLERSPLAVTVKVNGDIIQFDGLPDGLKSIISWVADLSLRLEAIPWEVEQDIFSQPIILFLDEVDIHLHPKWQRRILPAIQKLLPNSQIFVTTHSPFVVGSVENAWVYRLPEPGVKTEGVMEIEGVPSGAGKSYRLILNEIFGIDKEFDIETEDLFDEFYQARAIFLKTPINADNLIKIANQLAARGDETAAIVTRELRQMSRVTGVEVSLA